MIRLGPSWESNATPPYSGIGDVLTAVHASLLVRYLELRGVCYLGILFILGVQEDQPVQKAR